MPWRGALQLALHRFRGASSDHGRHHDCFAEDVHRRCWQPDLLLQYETSNEPRPWYKTLKLWFGIYAAIWFYLDWRFWQAGPQRRATASAAATFLKIPR